mmetsp:Transcript_12485/g.38090  ORF Transcript_12485/g.38090 Transcript_12485/m.38090 type:complete len:206 (-) Transcript_12485:695-1312(-)
MEMNHVRSLSEVATGWHLRHSRSSQEGDEPQTHSKFLMAVSSAFGKVAVSRRMTRTELKRMNNSRGCLDLKRMFGAWKYLTRPIQLFSMLSDTVLPFRLDTFFTISLVKSSGGKGRTLLLASRALCRLFLSASRREYTLNGLDMTEAKTCSCDQVNFACSTEARWCVGRCSDSHLSGGLPSFDDADQEVKLSPSKVAARSSDAHP